MASNSFTGAGFAEWVDRAVQASNKEEADNALQNFTRCSRSSSRLSGEPDHEEERFSQLKRSYSFSAIEDGLVHLHADDKVIIRISVTFS